MPATGAPDDVAGTLALRPGGHCVFHRDGSCSIYSTRPSSCSHFPYVCLIDQRGVHVTLSHYCPTAAALLFEHDRPIAIVEGPAPPTGLDIPEGLDARDSLPPLASPNRLMSFDEFAAWEADAIGSISAHMTPHVAWPETPQPLEEICARLVAPAWPAFEPVITRYLAAKTFGSWEAYLNEDGTAAVLRALKRRARCCRSRPLANARKPIASSTRRCSQRRSVKATYGSSITPTPECYHPNTHDDDH